MAASLPDTLLTPGVAAPAPAGAAAQRRRRALAPDIFIPAAILALIAGGCFLWPLVYPVPAPVGGSILSAGLPPFSPGHILGTDPVGHDILSRILYGGRVSIEVGLAVTLIGRVIGGVMGSVAAYSGGIVDTVLMRVLDVLIAFPPSSWRSPSPKGSGRATCTSSGRCPSSACPRSPGSPAPAHSGCTGRPSCSPPGCRARRRGGSCCVM